MSEIGGFYMPEKDKITFKDIMFKHFDRILEMTKYQFIGGYTNKTIVGGNIIESIVTDKKEEYCQLVEAFADILYGHFDEEIKPLFVKYEEDLDEAFKKAKDEYQYSKERLKLDRKLFRYLCTFLKRKQYLTTMGYVQTDKPRKTENK